MFNSLNWQPLTKSQLQQQAKLLQDIRKFFFEKNVLEVTTPILSPAATPDLAIQSLETQLHKTNNSEPLRFYLHSSPEFAMKRLLVNGSGDIFQICQVFRDSDFSAVHNAEFTLVEWYRLQHDHHQLMDEVFALMQYLFPDKTLQRIDISYQSLFESYTGIDPFTTSIDALRDYCDKHALSYPATLDNLNGFLDLILSFVIQPNLPEQQLTFVYDYPESQAALAKVRKDQSPHVASRFEMYWGSLECANGFHELQDATEQRQRFIDENKQRHTPVVVDDAFLHALENGLPDCSGVALGLSRLFAKLALS